MENNYIIKKLLGRLTWINFAANILQLIVVFVQLLQILQLLLLPLH